MNRMPILTVAVLILIVAHGSDASSLFENFRKLAGIGSKDKPQEISPTPGPVPSPSRAHISGKASSNDAQAPDISPMVHPNDDMTSERCSVSSHSCHDGNNLTACLLDSATDPRELFLLVQNDSESLLKVNATISGVKNIFQEKQIPKHQAKKINISANVGGSSIELNAGNGVCLIHLVSPKSGGNFSNQSSFYATSVTLIYGAYFLFAVALIVGGTWACCKLGRRGRQVDGIPYQELEMGQSESLSLINVETAEGWDQGWDDDWDETKAVKSPGGRERGSVSGNGLTSRSSYRNGLANNWDD